MLLAIHGSRPICGKLVTFAIQFAPDRTDTALRHYDCPRSGLVEMTPISMLRGPIRLSR
jgi:hypothetical protein